MITPKLRALPYVVLLLPLDLLVAACLAAAVALSTLLGRRAASRSRTAGSPSEKRRVATIQILNWDGKHLLKECLPSVLEAIRVSGGPHRVLVVDNGSTDGSAEFVAQTYPQVRVLRLDRNYGFVGGNNRGVDIVDTDVVVLLNNDMTVAPDFLNPILDGFVDDSVFAVTSQIFFEDSARRREETGKTRGLFERGFLTLWHAQVDAEDEKKGIVPVFWAGGGSCAFDRQKYQEIGGLDPLYHPFYVEDTDLSYQAWKRGWKCLLAPKSRVVHKHRATAGKKYGHRFVDNTIRRNIYLFIWKNITDPGMILEHARNLPRIHGRGAIFSGGWFEAQAYARAVLRLPHAISRRLRNAVHYRMGDREVQGRSQ